MQDEESSDEFELVSNTEKVETNELPQETTQEDAEKDKKAGETMTTLKEFVKEASDDEDLFEGQLQEISFMLEDLDEKKT